MNEMTSTSKYTKEEFDEHESTVKRLTIEINDCIENAENKGNFILDNRVYSKSYRWRIVAKIALKLADEADWFDRYFDRNSDYHD